MHFLLTIIGALGVIVAVGISFAAGQPTQSESVRTIDTELGVACYPQGCVYIPELKVKAKPTPAIWRKGAKIKG